MVLLNVCAHEPADKDVVIVLKPYIYDVELNGVIYCRLLHETDRLHCLLELTSTL